MALLSVKGLTKSYGVLRVLKGIDFTLNAGEIVAMMGSSGAGKSTFLHIAGLLDEAESGSILIDNQDVTRFSVFEKAKIRRTRIGFIFQFHHLLQEFTALENVALAARINGISKKAAEERGKELLDYLGLESRMNHFPDQLSGGEQQRVAIARALVNRPGIILADEPTGNLDSANSLEVQHLLHKISKEYNTALFIATHNSELGQSADRLLHLKDGVIY